MAIDKEPFHVLISTFVSCVFVFISASLYAAQMPDYERLLSISEKLTAPTAVAVDLNGKVYVTESSRNRLAVFNGDGAYVKEFLELDKPIGLAVDGNGKVYVCNGGRKNVEVYDGDFNLLFKLGKGDGEFVRPIAVAVAVAGSVYVADGGADTVRVYKPDGTFQFSFGSTGRGDGQFNFPVSISIDERAGEVIVSDLQKTPSGTYGARVQVFSMDGTFKRSIGSFGYGEGLLSKPMGVVVDGDALVYVSDSYQNVVQVFDGSGAFLGLIRDSDNPFRTPLGLAISNEMGRLYVASLKTSKVDVFGSETQDLDDRGGDTHTGGSAASSSGGSCMISRVSPGTGHHSFGWVLPLLIPLGYRVARRVMRYGS